MASYATPEYAIYLGDEHLEPEEVVKGIEALATQKTPHQIGQYLKFYDIDPADVVANYNIARGTNFTPEQAYQFLLEKGERALAEKAKLLYEARKKLYEIEYKLYKLRTGEDEQ